MDNSVIELIENLLVSNATLRQLADAGEWDAFFDESVAYTMGMRTLCDIDLTQLAQHNKAQVSARLSTMLENDALLTRAIQGRLASISSELSAMRKTSSVAKAYSAV
ncbi:flagellar protein FliT [Enterobacter cloacae]|uniref:flagellar protein FliT n=1 Tax=Enterobacter cloacae TaxID=550 RepID=UPI001F1D08AF|nr:flagellar protein FliT [Enterobacter cloacae]ELE9011539.1 flagellar protein FliT [Enterobacter cloacae]ELV2769823.1 flagellar protein FliT [Enterobacter cloacae]ELV2779058.1 flagellar protein FliT [Enterobacter cloacae]MCU6282251.1 flagellar protein FliT [Enterobacter cloacae]HEC5280908.1 flagellar protein FliT [Enterobacter cloacae]